MNACQSQLFQQDYIFFQEALYMDLRNFNRIGVFKEVEQKGNLTGRGGI